MKNIKKVDSSVSLTLCSSKKISYRTRVNILFGKILARICEFSITLWRLGTLAIIISVKRLFDAVFQSRYTRDTLLYKSNSLLLKFADRRVFNFYQISRLPAHNLLSSFELAQTLGRAFAANGFLTQSTSSKEKLLERGLIPFEIRHSSKSSFGIPLPTLIRNSSYIFKISYA